MYTAKELPKLKTELLNAQTTICELKSKISNHEVKIAKLEFDSGELDFPVDNTLNVS